MSYENPQAQYNATLDLIRRGVPAFEEKARKLAREYNIDTKDLAEALELGNRRLLVAYVELIAQGRQKPGFREKAETLAKKLGQDLDELVTTALLNSTADITI